MNYESGIVVGRLKVVYVLQFEKTIPYFFQVKNLFWQIGPAFILSLLSFLWLILLAIKNKNKPLIVFLIFPLMY